MPDAIVIGAGPNGLVAANMLVDAGWDTVVLEAQDHPGGAVVSDGYLGPGYTADVCSAFYPLAVASPAIRALKLESYGLEWCRSPAVLAHPLPGGRSAVLWPDVDRTADSVEELGAGDGQAWRRLVGLWSQVGPSLVDALFTPFPPLRAGAKLVWRSRAAGGLRLARFAALPVRRLVEEELAGDGAAMLLAGCALHTDLSPEAAAGTLIGWLLAMLGQDVGFPVPRGGAGQLSGAMVRRLERRGGRIRCGARVVSVTIRAGRAVGVVTEDGQELRAQRAILADVAAPELYGKLVAWDHLPARLRQDLARFQWDQGTFKVDWALGGPIPWLDPDVGQAGTVHLADSLDEMTQYCADLAMGRVPALPFVLLGQMAAADASRCPPGTEVVWAYTHIPRRVLGDAGGDGITGRWDERELEAMARRMERRIEGHAPGFSRLVTARHILGPAQLQAHDANLVGGALNGGTSALHQQLVLRPTPGLGRPETPITGLYLGSSSAHPGGGVHGACGANAALAALRSQRAVRRVLLAPARARARRHAGS